MAKENNFFFSISAIQVQTGPDSYYVYLMDFKIVHVFEFQIRRTYF